MDAWFGPETARLFSLLAFFSLFSLFGVWTAQGRHRQLVTGAFAGAAVLGIAFLAAAGAALVLDQPDHVIRALAVSGFILTFLFSFFWWHVREAYRQFEHRKIAARDM